MNPGTMYKTKDGQYAIAYNKEQQSAWLKIRKLFVHIYIDRLFSVAKIDDKGKPYTCLKAVTQLTPIGFTD